MNRPAALYVEDEPADCVIVSSVFRRVAPEVLFRAVVDGDEAIAYLSGRGSYANRESYPQPQMVLLDLKLPKKSGIDVLLWIRSQSALQYLPIIVWSSSSDPALIHRLHALGANSYLIKKFDVAGMRDIIRALGVYAALMGAGWTRNKLALDA